MYISRYSSGVPWLWPYNQILDSYKELANVKQSHGQTCPKFSTFDVCVCLYVCMSICVNVCDVYVCDVYV